MSKETRIGFVPDDFGSFILREKLTRNNAGEWGVEPDESACGVLRSTNFTNEGILDLNDVARRTLSEAKRRQKSLREGDIIIERSGGSDNQPVGRVGYITADIGRRGYSFSNFIQRISLDGSVNPKFVFHCLHRMHEMGVTLGMQTQTTGIRNLDYKFYSRSCLPLPSRVEQDGIVVALESVDGAVAVARESIAKAERLQKGLMQQLLTGRLKPDGTPRRDTDFKTDDHFGRLPRNWHSARIKNLITSCEYGLSRAMSEHGRYPIFRMNNIERGRMVAAPLAYIDLSPEDFARYRVRRGDILFNRTNTIELVGKVGIFALEGDFVFASYLVRLVANEENDPRFLNYYLNSFEGQKRIAAKVTPSIGQANINTRSLKSVWAVKPPRDEQSAIADRLDALYELIRAKERKIAALQQLKKSLMQNLLTGQIRLI